MPRYSSPSFDAEFPIDLSKYKKVCIDPFSTERLSEEQRADITANIGLCRDAIVFFTACGGASGYGGHTGGAFDTVPEAMLLDAFFRACPDKFVPTLFDEAGHRVATQYLFSVLKGHMPAKDLVKYRAGYGGLPGHPELGLTPGIEFSSGRLGHMWPHLNGVSFAERAKCVCCLGSDGSQMEGNNAEAARIAVANRLNVNLFIDDNDVTIAGHPSEYMKGYDIVQSLKGHGLDPVVAVDGEDLDAVYAAMRAVIMSDGPGAVVLKRKMCPGVQGVEGSCHGHDAMAAKNAKAYLAERGHTKAVEILDSVKKTADPNTYAGAGAFKANRQTFGEAVVQILKRMPTEEERKEKVLVVDSDLEGSCGLLKIREECPEVYVKSGVMERGNFSACAGFGFYPGKQGIFGTFAAFQEMIISEVTMARLNRCNVLVHFSHSGVDDMSDNNCHFGLNNFFADCGLEEESGPKTQLFMPADANQMSAVVEGIWSMEGLRFVYSTRAKVPVLLNEQGAEIYGNGYQFQPGKDDVILPGSLGYVVSYGDALYRCYDAVLRLRKEGLAVGLINKCHLNVVDEDMMQRIGGTGFVLVVESSSTKTGLGVRFGTWLLERGIAVRYARCGTHKEGCGGTWEHAYYQGFAPDAVMAKVRSLIPSTKVTDSTGMTNIIAESGLSEDAIAS
jgi:transketolase